MIYDWYSYPYLLSTVLMMMTMVILSRSTRVCGDVCASDVEKNESVLSQHPKERDDIRYTIGRDAFFVLRDDDDDDDAKRRPPPRFCPSSIVVIDFFLGRDDATPPRRARRPPFTTTATRESASDGHRGRMFGLSIGRGEL